MLHTLNERPDALLPPLRQEQQGQHDPGDSTERKGFGASFGATNTGNTHAGGNQRKGHRKRSPKRSNRRNPALSKADWGPLGKHPNLDAIVARQRLHLPLSGRLTAADVNQAWKRCASEHHPDRGGAHNTMQLVNGARDLLLGRNLS
jgi:hypothetical protein